jgi:glycosyltransferase involved in cell wall biosynthesis
MLYSNTKKREVGRVIDRFAPDVVHVHNTYPSLGPAVVLAASERRVPVVMTIHNLRLRCPNGLMFTEGAICRRCESGSYVNAITHACFPTHTQAAAYATALWVHRFVMRLERRIARFVAPSDFMKRRLLGWGVPDERVRLVRHFVPAAEGSGLDGVVGSYGAFVGRLSAEKGLDGLLKALGRAGDPPFMIVGDGPMSEALERLARQLGLVNTKFVGRRTRAEVSKLMEAARYIAVPSVWEENAPLSALEALRAARPLLVADRGGLPELVATGAGLLFRPGDESDLAEKVVQLMRDEDLCRRSSIEAARLADEMASPQRHMAHLEAVYKEVASLI